MTSKFSSFIQRLAITCVIGFISCSQVAAQNVKPASTKSVGALRIVEKARVLLSTGKQDAALELLSTQLRVTPNDYGVRQLLGTIYYQKNDFPRTIQHISSALENPASNPSERWQMVQMLALSHYALGHFKDAIPYLEQVQANVPNNTEIAYALGNSYVITHDAGKARASYARLFQVSPDSAAAHLINAQMMVRQQFEEVAEKELRRAAELDPKLSQVNFMLGEMAIYRARIDEGIGFLSKEITLNPGFGMAYYRLGEALTRQLKWTEAIAPLQKAVLLNPNFSGSYIVLGKVYLKQNNLDNAEAMLRRASQMDPNNFSAHHLLAQVLQQANRPDEARRELQIAEQLRGTTPTK